MDSLLQNLKIKNFKCFRKQIVFPLSQGTYFIGTNNAGKTATLGALHFFFDGSLYNDESFLNRTEYLAKKSGYNKSELSVEFSLNAIINKALKSRLTKYFSSKNIIIKKIITYSPDSRRISFSYEIKGNLFNNYEEIDRDIRKLLESVKITYIHPQEGKELLANVQEKLKQRLLANWGRNPKLSHSIEGLQDSWELLRKQARKYLSASLTDNIQKMWVGSQVSIDLPKNIRDIIAISDISLKSDSILPEIELTSQGTGAQSTVLYLAHYLLDSDRSLHRGEYHPIWLLEEPESFLHADLIIKFSSELNSENWLNNIQMLISTHSPIVLAISRMGEKKITWNLIQDTILSIGKNVEKWDEKEIVEIGKIMGDSNFYIYFSVSKKEKIVFIEDKKEIIKNKFEENGIKIEQGLNGTPQVAQYINVFLNSPEMVKKNIYFILDNDNGIQQLKRFIEDIENPIKDIDGFRLYKVKGSTNVFMILLLEDFNVESMFDEYENHLAECIDNLWDTNNNWNIKETIPRELTRVCAGIRSKNISSIEEGKRIIRNEQDVKELFWKMVDENGWKLNANYVEKIKKLINYGTTS